MSRKIAVFLGSIWLSVLAVANGAFLLRAEGLRGLLDAELPRLFRSDVTYRTFEGGWPGEITLRDVVIAYPGAPGKDLLRARAIHLELGLFEAMFGSAPVVSVRIERPHLELAWSAGGILELPSPLHEGGGGQPTRPPRVVMEGLSVRLVNTPYVLKEQVDLELPTFRVELIPDGTDRWMYQFDASFHDDGLGALRAFGRFSADDLDIEFRRRDFVVTERLRDILRPEIVEVLDRFVMDGDFELVGTLAALEEADESREGPGARFRATMEFGGVTVALKGPDGAVWPQKVQDLTGTVTYSDGHLRTERPLSGHLEGARLSLTASGDFDRTVPEIRVSGTLEDLRLSDDLVHHLGALPDPGPEVQEQLRQWELRGPAHVSFVLETERGLGVTELAFVPQLDVALRGCTLCYRGPVNSESGERQGFPYPIRNLWGNIGITDGELRINGLEATEGSLDLKARGRIDFSRPGDETYQAQVWISRLPMDERLTQALEPEVAEFLRDLRLDGSVDVVVNAERRRDQPVSIDPEVVVRLNGVTLNPRGFPYRLENTVGQVRVGRDSFVELEGLSVKHGSGWLGASGRVGVGPRSGELMVSVQMKSVPLDDDLLTGLRELVPDVATVLTDQGVSGVIDRATVDVIGRPGAAGPHVEALLFVDDGVLAPKDPAIRIDGIDCALEIQHRPGRPEITIRPGATGYFAGRKLVGEGAVRPGDEWFVTVEAPDATIDETLLEALAGVLPELGDPTQRPVLEGTGSAKVSVGARGGESTFSAALDIQRLTLTPPGWKDTRLEDITCRVEAESGGLTIRDFVAAVPRPSHLAPLPPPVVRPESAPFRIEPGVILRVASADVSTSPEGLRLGLSDVELTGVPLEPWVLEIFGVSQEERREWSVPMVSGLLNLKFRSANLGPNLRLLNQGQARLLGLHVGSGGQFYLEEGTIENFDFGMDARGRVRFGGETTRLQAINSVILGVPIPSLEGRLDGDGLGFAVQGIVGVVFGFDYDPFDLRTAPTWALRLRAVHNEYLTEAEARSRTDEQLRELIRSREAFDIRGADEPMLRAFAIENDYTSRARAELLNKEQLSRLIEDKRRARPLGVVCGDGTGLYVGWDGTFRLDAALRDVYVGPALQVLGGSGEDILGRLNARLALAGRFGDSHSWVGDGRIRLNGIDVVRLPLFLNILKAIDVSAWIPRYFESRLDCAFQVGDGIVTLTEGHLESPRVDLLLEPPGTITFGGIINARLDARHRGGMIPIVSDILEAIPSLLLDGVVVEGPLEDPAVQARSFGLGPGSSGTSGGRKPLLKPPKGGG